MSQDQATESKTTNHEPASSVKKNHSIHDPMAAEEIRTSFQEKSNRVIQSQKSTKDTSSFRLGLAEAFAQEEDIQEDFTYVPPAQLAKIRDFMSSFDFSNRNDPTHRFEIVSGVYNDIVDIQNIVRKMNAQSSFDFQARQQLQEDLYLLETYRKQTSDFMEETRPTY
ncbi:MAG: hypothetical protein CL916_14050 [Deltaproteobacteria bacterium]|nr:hypothetical protein [Deltaproteobacteria bacterium]